jgi:hypothetical protein
MMGWLWTHVLKPVLKAAADFLWSAVKWAVENPVASLIIGSAALIGSLFFPRGTELRAQISLWGSIMVVSGVVGWVLDLFGPLDKAMGKLGKGLTSTWVPIGGL